MSKIILQPLGCVQIAVAGTALAGTALQIPTGAERALIVPETNGIRYRDDGGTPTANVGMPIAALGTLSYDGNVSNIKIIAQSGTASVNIAYYGGSGGFNA